MERQLLIGDLAQQVGVNPKTIRYYEKIGVLPLPRRLGNGYRVYDEEDVTRLRLVRGARSLDLALEDIAEILDFRDRGVAPCRYVLDLLYDKIQEVDDRIAELERLRGDLRRLTERAERLPMDDIEMKECVCHLVRDRPAEPSTATAP